MGSEREMGWGTVVMGLVEGEERIEGRERLRVGGRRWRREERESPASEAERRLGWVDGVGGGAVVAP